MTSTELYDVEINIEHAGPTWEIRKVGITSNAVGSAIDGARYIAPLGATIKIKVTPHTEPAYNLTEAGHAAIAD